MTSALAAFLEARLADAEPPEICGCKDTNHWPPCIPQPWNDRIRRELTAKRALIRIAYEHAADLDGDYGCGHTPTEIAAGDCPEHQPDTLPILRELASTDSDHPDWNPAWKP